MTSTSTSDLFLQALAAALRNTKVEWTEDQADAKTFVELFQMAQKHHVLPMIFEAVYACDAANVEALAPLMHQVRMQVQQAVFQQTMKTVDFERLYGQLIAAGVKPLVVKGLVCRSIYPQPDQRMSGDEDVLIRAEEFIEADRVLSEYGLHRLEPEKNADEEDEVPYGKAQSQLKIELHKSLFPRDNKAYGDFNRFFEHVEDRAVQVKIDGVEIWMPEYTDHLFYLICHAFKHFLHSGFGIRQVCDIVRFAENYGDKIDWRLVREQCEEIHALQFTASMFQIGERYLGFDPAEAGIVDTWGDVKVDCAHMLEDLLDGGVYGGADMSRQHSATITVNAAAAAKQGKKTGKFGTIMKSLFPSVKYMKRRYHFLERMPWLLPVAWIRRILTYRKETAADAGNGAAEAMQIGQKRIDLLREYGAIK